MDAYPKAASLLAKDIHALLVLHTADDAALRGLLPGKIMAKDYALKEQMSSTQTISGLTGTFERRKALYKEVPSNIDQFLAALAAMKQDANFYTVSVSFDCGYAMIIQQSDAIAVLLSTQKP